MRLVLQHEDPSQPQTGDSDQCRKSGGSEYAVMVVQRFTSVAKM